MPKFLRKIPTGIYIAIGVVLFIVMLFTTVLTPLKGRWRMEMDFKKNKESILLVKNYLVGVELDSVTIYDSSGTMFGTQFGGSIPIEDDKVKEAIRLLFKNGYKVISNRDGYITFIRWSHKDAGSGAAYSINGSTPTPSSIA